MTKSKQPNNKWLFLVLASVAVASSIWLFAYFNAQQYPSCSNPKLLKELQSSMPPMIGVTQTLAPTESCFPQGWGHVFKIYSTYEARSYPDFQQAMDAYKQVMASKGLKVVNQDAGLLYMSQPARGGGVIRIFYLGTIGDSQYLDGVSVDNIKDANAPVNFGITIQDASM